VFKRIEGGEVVSMTHDEMIAVIQAHKDGKGIEARMIDCGDTWGLQNNDVFKFDFSNVEYRIKPYPPKPRPMTFDEAIKFVRANPRFELLDSQGDDVYLFSSIWYRPKEETIWHNSIETLKWREEPGKKWKEFTIEGEL